MESTHQKAAQAAAEVSAAAARISADAAKVAVGQQAEAVKEGAVDQAAQLKEKAAQVAQKGCRRLPPRLRTRSRDRNPIRIRLLTRQKRLPEALSTK